MAFKVRIKNIHKWAYEEDISKAFAEQLALTPAKVKIETYGPKSLEKGWAEFSTEEEAQKALQLNGYKIREQPLQVTIFQPEDNIANKSKNKSNDGNPNAAEKPANKNKPKNAKQQKKPPNTPTTASTPPPSSTSTSSTPSSFTPSSIPSSTSPNHSPVPPSPSSSVSSTTNNTQTANQPRAKKGAKGDAPGYKEEFERVQAKYKTFKIESSNPVVASLLLPPSDPDFPFDLKGLQLQITIPPNYPSVPCIFKVMNPDSEVTEKLKKKIEAAVQKRAQVAYKDKPMLAGLLFWLDRNMEQILVDKQMTEDFNLAKMGIQLVVNATFKPPPRELTKETEQPIPPTPPVTTTSTEKSEEPATAEHAENVEDKPTAPTPTITTALKGTRIKFEEMALVNVGILECVLLNITVTCEKCRSRIDAMNLIKGMQITEVCEKCNHAYSVGFRPEIMHEYSNIVGYLDLEGCAIFDILPSSFKVACFECNGSALFKDMQYSDTKTEKNCMQCHQKISISLSRPAFTKMKAKKIVPIDPALLEEKKKKKKRDPNDLLIRPGNPLPNEGTCKHYKHSYRWLRFPCCGKAFPCDVCHEIATNNDHEVKWANRMICGFCSREQAWSQKPCVACGGDTTGSIHSKFWEGGEGQRDKSKMSNKDSHKFKNSSLKTQSQKSKRVGPKKE